MSCRHVISLLLPSILSLGDKVAVLMVFWDCGDTYFLLQRRVPERQKISAMDLFSTATTDTGAVENKSMALIFYQCWKTFTEFVQGCVKSPRGQRRDHTTQDKLIWTSLKNSDLCTSVCYSTLFSAVHTPLRHNISRSHCSGTGLI